MKHRNFIRVALRVATAAAVVPTCLLANVADAQEKYYEAFRDRCRRLAEQGYEIKACWLAPPQDGFRQCNGVPLPREPRFLPALGGLLKLRLSNSELPGFSSERATLF